MKNTYLILISIIIGVSFFSCEKIEFGENDINLDDRPTVWQVLKQENSDLLSNKVKSIKHQKSTGLMWFLTDGGLQSYRDGNFTNHNILINRNITEMYWSSENTLLLRTTDKFNNAVIYNSFNTTTKKVNNSTELEWNKVKHGIEFSYRTKDNIIEQIFIIEDGDSSSEYNFEAMLMDKIGGSLSDFTTLEVEEVVCDSTILSVIEDEGLAEQLNDLCEENSDLLPIINCPYEIGDTIFSFGKEVLLSDGSTMDFSLNEFGEIPTAIKTAGYNSNTMSALNEIGFEGGAWGNVSCWVYPSNEVCSDNFTFNYDQAAVDKDKTIYLRFDDHLVIYKDETFKAIPYGLVGYNFILIKGVVYLTNKNTLLAIEGNNINTLYTSQVDCWVLGNQELQGFTKIENELWMANCENVVRCIGNNCESKRVEHLDMNLFELRSNAIEVIDGNEIWIGYHKNGIYTVKWND